MFIYYLPYYLRIIKVRNKRFIILYVPKWLLIEVSQYFTDNLGKCTQTISIDYKQCHFQSL